MSAVAPQQQDNSSNSNTTSNTTTTTTTATTTTTTFTEYRPPFLLEIPLAKDEAGVVYYFVNVTMTNNASSSSTASPSKSTSSSSSSSSSHKHCVHKRFSQFETLQSALLAEFDGKVIWPIGCALPPKSMKMLQSHSDPWFVEERRCLLEAFLSKLLLVPALASSTLLHEFVQSDVIAAIVVDTSTHATNFDDSEISSVCIPATRTMSDHILYQIDVMNERRRKSFSKWTVLKRFQQVYEMDAALRAAYATSPSVVASLPCPPARQWKIMYDHLDDTFVEHRRLLLVNYLNRLIRHPQAYKEPLVLEFLGVRNDS